MSNGLVLFAHGSRDPSWAGSLRLLARLAREREPDLRVRVAFLEFTSPDLATVLAELAAECRRVSVLPVFWSAGGHVRDDLGRMLSEASLRHTDTQFDVLPTLSELPGLLPFLADTAVRLSR